MSKVLIVTILGVLACVCISSIDASTNTTSTAVAKPKSTEKKAEKKIGGQAEKKKKESTETATRKQLQKKEVNMKVFRPRLETINNVIMRQQLWSIGDPKTISPQPIESHHRNQDIILNLNKPVHQEIEKKLNLPLWEKESLYYSDPDNVLNSADSSTTTGANIKTQINDYEDERMPIQWTPIQPSYY